MDVYEVFDWGTVESLAAENVDATEILKILTYTTDDLYVRRCINISSGARGTSLAERARAHKNDVLFPPPTARQMGFLHPTKSEMHNALLRAAFSFKQPTEEENRFGIVIVDGRMEPCRRGQLKTDVHTSEITKPAANHVCMEANLQLLQQVRRVLSGRALIGDSWDTSCLCAIILGVSILGELGGRVAGANLLLFPKLSILTALTKVTTSRGQSSRRRPTASSLTPM